jgi:hypothetical protein
MRHASCSSASSAMIQVVCVPALHPQWLVAPEVSSRLAWAASHSSRARRTSIRNSRTAATSALSSAAAFPTVLSVAFAVALQVVLTSR